MRAPRLVGPALAVLLAAAAPAAAQDDCEWLAPSGDFVRQGGIVRVATPHLLCSGGVRIRGDSARYYDVREYYEIYGNVLYQDQERILRSQRAQYFRRTGRLQAQTDVRLTRRSDNALITGDNLVQEEGRGTRPDVMTVMGGRPHATLYVTSDTVRSDEPPADPAASEAAPWEVDGDRIEIVGEQTFEATGNVEIRRDSLEAYGDRSLYDFETGRLTLFSRARMVDGGYTLEGDTIEVLLPGNEIEEVVSRTRAVLTGTDLDVRGPFIRMLMTGGALERMVALTGPPTDSAAADTMTAEAPPVPPLPQVDESLEGAPLPPATDAALMAAEHPARPVARARAFVILADSVDVRLPGEVLERLVAVGDAHGESTGRDSLAWEGLPEVARRDWLDGRTIEAVFGRVEAPAIPGAEAADTARSEYRLESLTASGSARSLYRMAARDTATATAEGVRRPALHYVVGDTIILSLQEGEIRNMTVVGQVRGVHWEPVGRPAGGTPASSGGGGGTPGRRRSGPAPPGGPRAGRDRSEPEHGTGRGLTRPRPPRPRGSA